jgi:hypothetical protein
VLYGDGVGNRLDSSQEFLLFVLRGVNHLELIEQAIPTAPLGRTKSNAHHARALRPRSDLGGASILRLYIIVYSTIAESGATFT